MTVKEFLNKVRRQNSVLLTYERELSELRLRMVNISSPGFGDKVRPITSLHWMKSLRRWNPRRTR